MFFVPGATFLSVYHYFELCVMLCHAMEMYSVQVEPWYVTYSVTGVADLFLYWHVSQGSFLKSMYDF